MSECYCDYEPSTVYSKTMPIARKQHRCDECFRPIAPGEQYERVFGVWDGDASTFRTCAQCLALREYVLAHVPCLCWSHGSMIDDCISTADEYAHEAPGLLFGARRRQALIYRAKRT